MQDESSIDVDEEFSATAGRAVIALRASAWLRVAGGLAGAALIAGAIGWVGFLAFELVDRNPAAAGWVLGVALTLPALPTVRVGWALARRAIAQPGRLTIDEDWLVIDHPGVLRAPARIPRTALRAVAIDADPVQDAFERWRFPVTQSFSWAQPTGPGNGGTNHVYSTRSGSALPLLSATPDEPNVAIAFVQPLVFDDARLGSRRAFEVGRPDPCAAVRRGEPIAGMLLAIEDAAQVEPAFAPWGVVRSLMEDDFAPSSAPLVISSDGLSEMADAPSPAQLDAAPTNGAQADATEHDEPGSLSLRGRALLAIGLTVGYYGISVALAGALLGAAYYGFAHGRSNVLSGLAAIAGGVVLAVLLRRVAFQGDGREGLRLTPASQPRLFAAIEDIAIRVAASPPDEVLLVAWPGAAVYETGALPMLRRARRVLLLGLPMFAALTADQLRSVIAHELAHYRQGDTRVGRRMHRAQVAIDRTLHSVRPQSGGTPLRVVRQAVRPMFESYARTFLRLTAEADRRQEFAADAASALVVGARETAESLIASDKAGWAFGGYWHHEVAPVLDAGYRPPLLEGMRHYLAAPAVARAVRAEIEQRATRFDAPVHARHPALGARIAAVRQIGDRTARISDATASTALLDDLVSLEAELLDHLGGHDRTSSLEPIAWSAVAATVYVPAWRPQVARFPALADLTIQDLADVVVDPARLLGPLGTHDPVLSGDEVSERATPVYGAALTLALFDRGWSVEVLPGEDFVARGFGGSLKPFVAFRGLVTGSLSRAEWIVQCTRLQIGHYHLGRGADRG